MTQSWEMAELGVEHRVAGCKAHILFTILCSSLLRMQVSYKEEWGEGPSGSGQYEDKLCLGWTAHLFFREPGAEQSVEFKGQSKLPRAEMPVPAEHGLWFHFCHLWCLEHNIVPMPAALLWDEEAIQSQTTAKLYAIFLFQEEKQLLYTLYGISS